MMTDLSKVVKVALMALTMMVGVQSAGADEVTVTDVVESTKTPFGFATRSSRTDSSAAYNITGGGAYTVADINALIEAGGSLTNTQMIVDGKKIIVLTSSGEAMDATILSAITNNDIIVFDGSGASKDFLIDAQIALRNMTGKTLIGKNGARLCTTWHMTDVIKSWLNAVETSSGSGVSNASTAAGTGGSFYLKNVAGEDSLLITIDEEGEFLTRKTLADKGSELYQAWLAGGKVGPMPENAWFLRTERYKQSGVFYIDGCSNFIIRNLSFVGPGSVDVGGVDLVSVINSTHHVWVDHCEFIDGQDGNFDITNESDYITASWCHFHYTDRSYVHQNTNLVGSSDSKVEDRGKLNITFAYNEWGENCRSRMPMGRFGKMHLLNNWYNCSGNTEYAVNPRLESEFLIEGNYFATGVLKTFRNISSTSVTAVNNTVADPSATALASSGTTVAVPYTYKAIASGKTPDMIELLVGPVLDMVPDFNAPGCVNVDNHTEADESEPGYYLTVTTNRAKQGLTFSVWANHVIGYQWYKATNAGLSDAVKIDGATRNSYEFKSEVEGATYLYCVATGLAGTAQSNPIKIIVSGSDAIPEFTTNLKDYATETAYTAIVGTPFADLAVNAGENVTYQWYKNSIASDENATLITGATSATYSFTPGETEKALGFQFFYCVATNEVDHTLSARSNIARVIYESSVELINFVATSTTAGTEGGGDMTGITLVNPEGAVDKDKTQIATKKYHANSDNLSILALNKSYLISENYSQFAIKLETDGGFKAGDVITIAGFYSNDAEKESAATLFTLDGEGKIQEPTLFTTGNFINGKTAAGEPTEYSYELTADADALYLGRTGNTGTFISKIIATRGTPATPYIRTDLDDENPYAVKVDRNLALSIEAEQAQTYTWYTCSSPIDYEANKNVIEGQTSATCNFVTSSPGTAYVYCVVTNGFGTKAKSVKSKIATINITSGAGGTTIKDWVFTDWTTETFTTTKTKEGLTAVATSNKSMAVSANKQTFEVDGVNWTSTNRMQFSGTGSSSERCLKFDVDGPTVVEVWAMHGSSTASNRPLMIKIGNAEATVLYTFTTGNEKKYATYEYEGDSSTTIYLYSGNSGINVYRIRATTTIEDDSACAAPKEEQGAWSGDASQKWTYTVSSTTATAHIHYKINDGEEQTEEDNSVELSLSPSDKVIAWAVDPTGTLATSNTLEFTAEEAAKAATPTITKGNYSIADKGFAVTLDVTEGSAIHYTTDGTEPTAESATYSSTIYVDPGATVKAIATKDYYIASEVVSESVPEFILPGGDELICTKNGKDSSKDNVGISYIVGSAYNAGAIDSNKPNGGLKFRTNQVLAENADAAEIYPDAISEEANESTIYRNYGFRINVHEGFVIKRIVATDIWTNADSGTKATFKDVYVDGSKTGKLSEEKKNQELNYRNVDPAGSIDISSLNAKDYIDFVFTGKVQVRATFQVYYEVDDDPVSITVTGKVAGETDTQTIDLTEGTYTYQIDKEVKMYDEKPVVVLNTTSGNAYDMGENSGDGTYTFFTKTVMDHEYKMRLRINTYKSPNANIDKEGGLKFYRDAQGMGRLGYKFVLEDVGTGTTPYIKIDGGAAVVYDSKKEYYALKQVKTYITYTDPETGNPAQTGDRTFDCPENNYDENKPAAIFIYQYGYNDGSAGQEDGASSSAWANDKDNDQIYRGLQDQYNVIDLVLHDADQKKMINVVRPDIRNAQLVVVSEMIGSKSPEASSVYAASKLQDAIMSVRDSLIGYTNVLNLKMFFYSQSQNNTTRWAWAQPATLPNNVVSIMPTNAMYKVFENVSFSLDGSIRLWNGYDVESTLNRLQLVHNFNEENEDLPQFTSLAEATDDYGEKYEALHFFEKNGYTYVGTGISINDYQHYDENLRALISTIGAMINRGESLGTVMDALPAPRIKDNGNGSATITNNSPLAVTYYKTGAADSNYDAATIKADNKTTIENLTEKFTADTYVWAVTEVNNALSAVASAAVKGTTKRYFHRLNSDAGAEGVESTIGYDWNATSVTVPYNQSFRKPGYTVTQWKVRGTETILNPGQEITDAAMIAQDIYLEAIWTKNTKKITDVSAVEESLRTVTWNFLQSDGAPALALEYGSTKLAQQGFVVGQLKFSTTPGDFIDIALDINTDNTTTLPGSTTVYNGKFNNQQNILSEANPADPERYLTEFAQVRAGTKFTFPSVYGMEVKFRQADFEKYTDKTNNVREKDLTYVTLSTLTDGTLTNPGLVTDETGAIVLTGGVATVSHDNLAEGGIYSYTGVDSLATLVARECAMYATPTAGTAAAECAPGSLNYGGAFMHSLTVVYPALYDFTKVVNFPEGHVYILPNYQSMTEEEIKDRAAKVTLSAAKKNCNGRYGAGTTVDISVVPGYGFYFEKDNPSDVTTSGLSGAMTIEKKLASGSFTITGAPVLTINLRQNTVKAYDASWTPLNAGSVHITSNTGKDEDDEYTAFPLDSTINITPTPKVGYQFAKWTNGDGVEYTTLPDGVTKAENGVLTVVVNETNAAAKYVAVFVPAKTGTTYYELPSAGLWISDTHYEQFGSTLDPGTPADNMYPNYHFPSQYTTSAIYIPSNYTLFKSGYTLKNWVWIEGFDPLNPLNYYEDQTKVHEYQIGEYHYFDTENEERHIIPIFRENQANFDYRTTTADITWDFRTAYYAQHMKFTETTEFDYATHATINKSQENPAGVEVDVPLHIRGKVDNTMLDEWCHFDEGTVITIPSGLGAKFTFVTYHKLSSTTIDGEVPLEYTQRTENDIPVYYYTYTTKNTATMIDLVIGKDHTYFKSLRAQLPAADKVTLTTTSNNDAWGANEMVKANTTEEKINDANEPSDVTYTTDGNVYTMPLGSYVKVKATRNRLYELKAFMVDGDEITMENAASKGYTMTAPADGTTDKEYTLTFRLQTYATVVEAVYGERKKWQVTYTSGSQAYGEAPGVQVVEQYETFTMPAKNQTLYLEGYTLKYWTDENGHNAVNADGTDTGANRYEWGKTYLPSEDLYLTPVFEINDFTLFNMPSGWHAVTWPLTTGDDATYGGAPLLKYQKSSGVYVSQLIVGDQFIDMPLNINCAETGKVDNSSTDYRCQINSGSVMTLLTSKNCRITLYTSNGELSSTKIAGKTAGAGGYTSNKVSGTVNDQYAIVSYTGADATQSIQYTGDASYFKMVKVEYGKVDASNLPQLAQVTINNIALGSYGSPYQNYMLSKLKSDKVMPVNITLSTTALTMPTVKAEADQTDAIVEVKPATVDEPTATIILKTKEGSTVGIYKIDFVPEYVAIPAPVMQKIEMNGKLIRARNVSDEYEDYAENCTNMSVNGAINITFDHEMNAVELAAGDTGLGIAMSANGGKMLTFSYWGLDVNKDYTFTIPAGRLSDVYGNVYDTPLSFTFRTSATSQTIVKRNVNFVVTHRQTYSFNTTDATNNYTAGVKRQVASDDLIANLEAAGIAHGTIDEGIELANSAAGKDRYYIFVPNGEYQLRGNQATDPISSAPYDGKGKPRAELTLANTTDGKGIYNGVTAIRKNNISITGQSEENTKLFNQPEIEGISYTSTFMVNSGVSGFYVQDMTLTNKFDYKSCIGGGSSAARAVVLRDRGAKTIMKNVTMDSWQDTYYSNVSNKDNDTRGYFENCTLKGYVDFICGDGDHWFEQCNLVLRNGKTGTASNMVAPRTYDNQKWGYVFNNCEVNVEDDLTYTTCNGKFTLARPWGNSPAASFLATKYNVLPSDDGYKQMSSSGLVLRMHEYGSLDANDALLDLSLRSLRASSPGAGSYSAVMTPAEAAEYTIHNALGGTDGYDPTLYTKQISMADAALTSVDRSLSWNEQSEALCYFIFRKNTTGGYDLFAVTADSSYELEDDQIGKTFMVRAANQRGGLGEPSNEFTYEVHESFKLTLTEAQQAKVDDVMWSWSTIYLDYNAKAPTVADDNDEADAYVYAVINVTPISMTLKRVKVLEKNQGYVVKGKPGTYTFSYTDSEGEYYTGDLTGAAYSDYTAVKADRMSILDGTVETVTGAYLNANKAYLDGSYVGSDGAGGIAIETQSSNSGFIFIDELGATDIQKVNNTVDDDDERIYTVYGQRVKRSEMIKGRVYIVNGRKLVY